MLLIPYLNLAIALILPLYFWLKDKKEYLLFWIVFTCFTDIVGNQMWFNLSGVKLCGLVLIPFAVMQLNSIPINLKKFITVYLAWNIFRALFELDNGLFSIAKQIGTQVSELSNVIIMITILKELGLEKLKKIIPIVIGIALLGILIEGTFSFDLFHFFTGGRELLLSNRLRGLSYEPRAFGYSMAMAMVFCLNFIDRKLIILFIFAALGLAASASISSIVLAFVGILIVAIPRFRDWRILIGISVTSVIVIFLGDWSTVVSEKVHFYWANLSTALTVSDYFIQLNEPAEAAVLNYLKSNPAEVLMGMGPGAQVSLVKPFILERDLAIWGRSIPLLPTMGYLLVISNIGILGFLFYSIGLWIKPLSSVFKASGWQLFCLSIFMMFLLQARNFHVLGLAVLWTLISEQKTASTFQHGPESV